MDEFNFIAELSTIFPPGIKGIHSTKLDKDRLAFLAATSKCEFVIRDEIAFRFHQAFLKEDRFSNKHYIVAREWENRYDLAILQKTGSANLVKSEPVYIIEFKAVSVSGKMDYHCTKVEEDILKLSDGKYPNAKKYIILILMIPEEPFDENFNGIVKYLRRINKQFIPNKKGSDIDKNKAAWASLIKKHGSIENTAITINAGNYYNVHINLQLLIAGPM